MSPDTVAGVDAVDAAVTPTISPEPVRSPADLFMRRLLRVDGAASSRKVDAERVFSTSVLISASRCLLTYVIFPFVAPALGFATGVGPIVGIVIGVVAIVFNIVSMRRFWRADHKWRWAYTAISSTIIVLLLVLLVRDVIELFT